MIVLVGCGDSAVVIVEVQMVLVGVACAQKESRFVSTHISQVEASISHPA